MSRWELWTWLAIAVLIFGSIGAFIWFLRDAVRLFRGELGAPGAAREETGGP
jgi:hypothetical protein